jgi:hypothetical protein
MMINSNYFAAMKLLIVFFMVLCGQLSVYSQSLLGKSKQEVTQLKKNCLAINNYPESLVFNCSGTKEYFYFQGKDSTCDMYARDMLPRQAQDTIQYLEANKFMKLETRYMEPFLVSKHSNHEKFPSRIYTDGTIQYCFMPVSLNGKTADLNAVIVLYHKK